MHISDKAASTPRATDHSVERQIQVYLARRRALRSEAEAPAIGEDSE